MTAAPKIPNNGQNRTNARTALVLAGVVVIMAGMAYASVPLYDLFCRVTGYGGTTQRAETGSGNAIDRDVVVRFDANVSGLPWDFRPENPDIHLKAGETVIVNYIAENRSNERTVGSATFNVAPAAAGAYFNKIQCFCFTRQVLQPGEKTVMPVQFFIDPAMDGDKDLRAVKTITLSYTFYPIPEAGQPVAQSGQDGSGKKL
jgi:cytochrome c oxidase assembly protein subunit 11